MKKLFLSAILFLSAFVFYAQENNVEVQKENEVIENSKDESVEEKKSSKKKLPKMDWILAFSNSRAWNNGISGNKDSYMKLRKDISSVEQSSYFSADSRLEFYNIKNFSFAGTFGFDIYTEDLSNDENKFSSINLSLGFGTYFHPVTYFDQTLSGAYLFIYPLYQMPALIWNNGGDKTVFGQYDKNDFAWKFGAETGYTFVFWCVTVSPYARGAIGWTKDCQTKTSLDLGVSIGLYLPDTNYPDRKFISFN